LVVALELTICVKLVTIMEPVDLEVLVVEALEIIHIKMVPVELALLAKDSLEVLVSLDLGPEVVVEEPVLLEEMPHQILEV
jgi:hypothetical protein